MALSLACCVFSGQVSAQYFGQNRVRYKPLNFKVLQTQHFDIYFYEEERNAAADTGRMAERWYARLSKFFGHQLSSRQPVVLYATPGDFRSTTVIPTDLGEGVGGVTEPLRRRVVMPLGGPVAETDHVLGHELVHAFQYDITNRYQVGQGPMGIELMPLWFVEGMAEYVSLGPVDPNTAMWMRDAVAEKKLPRIRDLEDPQYFPYRWGQALWAYIGGRFGDEVIPQMLRSGGRGGNVEAAIQSALKIAADELSKDWQNALKEEYGPIVGETVPAAQAARTLISEKRGGELNVSPAVSPDGKQVIFFSSKSLFSIDLFLADGATGAIKRKLTRTAIDAHLDSLTFISSTGAWSHNGELFAFGAVVRGRPVLNVYDIARGGIARRIPLHQLGEIYTPTWSPDGRHIAFSALTAGFTDLYVVDVDSGNLRRLTDDVYADLQPAWSPDGSRIAFVTDRFGNDPVALDFGYYRLALIDPATGNIEAVHAFDKGKHINPQWWPDGKSLFYVSDRDGISNIYRLSMDDNQISQITNVQTGVTGITALSPAFSLSAKANHLVFSAFVKGNYSIFSIDSPTALAGSAPGTKLARLDPATQPPHQRKSNVIAAMLGNPHFGLPPTQQFSVSAYKPRLELDYLAPPSIALGVSNFGTVVGGGTALYFSDLLNYHTLMVATETASATDGSHFLRNLTGIAAYENQRSRWDWGFIGGQIPFLTGAFAQGLTTVNGEPAVVQQDILLWQIERDLGGTFSYPFSRAERLEFSAGYQNLSYAAESHTQVFSLSTGELLQEQTQDVPTPDPLHFGTASAALVYDTSIFGGTSPVIGQRYRLELGGHTGSVSFSTLLADYRRYVHISRPLSLAGRLLHYGRYGGGANDTRLQDMFIGYPTLVRGYDPGSFSAVECGPQASQTGACPVFDRLLGSRIAVGNAEIRLGLFGPLGVVSSRYAPPMEIAYFYDAGIAWRGISNDIPRRVVSSHGPTMRFNVLGFFIAQLSYAHPNDRPFKNWVWQFSLTPGF